MNQHTAPESFFQSNEWTSFGHSNVLFVNAGSVPLHVVQWCQRLTDKAYAIHIKTKVEILCASTSCLPFLDFMCNLQGTECTVTGRSSAPLTGAAGTSSCINCSSLLWQKFGHETEELPMWVCFCVGITLPRQPGCRSITTSVAKYGRYQSLFCFWQKFIPISQ